MRKSVGLREQVVERRVKIINRLGLHARAAGKFRNLAAQFKSQIKVIKDNMEADAKSILGLMALGAAKGTELILRASGEDAEQAIEELTKLINDKFGEDE